MLKFTITMSTDGYVAGPNQSERDPLGEGGEALHEWVVPTRTFRTMHGMPGGETGPDDDVAAAWLENTGATIMGRHMFGGGDGDWGEAPWRGWWGDDPPFHTPVFVLTHYAREPLEMRGGTTFHFVTGGIHDALEQATRAAAGKDVALGGGADVAQQYLRAGLIDEMEIHVVPRLLGAGERLFEHTDGRQREFDCTRVVTSPRVTHYRFRRRR